MKNFIFNPTSVFTNKAKKDIDTEEKLYTIVGQHDFIDDQGNPRLELMADKVLAKQTIRKDSSTKFMVRLAANGKLFNPVSIYGMEEDNTFLNRVCRSNKKFKEVNEKTFDWYLKFLSSKNIAWLHNAEREME